MSAAGDWMRSVRLEAHQTMGQVADACGISVNNLSDIEHERRPAHMPELLRFCQHFDYDPFEALVEFEVLPEDVVTFLRHAAALTSA